MSKGWESKSIEQQQAEAAAPSNSAASTELTAEARRAEADRKRRIQALELQRERVLSERTTSPHRRSALELALATIERDLEQLGWSIKL
jgi:phage protein D